MKVHLNYFKPNGKHYASGEYDTAILAVELTFSPGTYAPPLYRIFEEVAELKTACRLPGLREGHSEFAVLIDVPEHPHRHPHLLPAEADLHAAQDVVRAAYRTLASSVDGIASVCFIESAVTKHDTTVGPLDVAPNDEDDRELEARQASSMSETETSKEPADREIDPVTYTDQVWVVRMIRRWLDEEPDKSRWTLTRGQLQGLLSVIDDLSEDE